MKVSEDESGSAQADQQRLQPFVPWERRDQAMPTGPVVFRGLDHRDQG